MTANWEELYKKSPAELSEKELATHIDAIKRYRLEETQCGSLSANECNTLLQLACSEEISRSSSKLSKVAIAIALISVVVSAAGIWLG